MISVVFSKVRQARPKKRDFVVFPQCVWRCPNSVISVVFAKVRLAMQKRRDFDRIRRSASVEAQKA